MERAIEQIVVLVVHQTGLNASFGKQIANAVNRPIRIFEKHRQEFDDSRYVGQRGFIFVRLAADCVTDPDPKRLFDIVRLEFLRMRGVEVQLLIEFQQTAGEIQIQQRLVEFFRIRRLRQIENLIIFPVPVFVKPAIGIVEQNGSGVLVFPGRSFNRLLERSGIFKGEPAFAQQRPEPVPRALFVFFGQARVPFVDKKQVLISHR